MQNIQIVADRIKIQAKLRNTSVKKILEDCDLGPNTITKISRGSDIVSQNLKKIADYLDCSTDYLLGRSDTPNMSNSVDNSVLINGSINNSNHSTLNVATPPQDEMTQQLIDGFKTLSFENKLKIMNTLFELKKES